MKELKLSLARSSGFDSYFDRVKKIAFDDEPFAAGGFGAMYNLISVDGKKPAIPQCVKIFHNSSKESNEHSWQTINKLQNKVIEEVERCKSSGESFMDLHPALLALPSLVFEGKLGGETMRGYISMNLKSLGMVSLDKVIETGEGEDFDSFCDMPMKAKFQMCYQLASAFRFLGGCGFIHADITPDNLFVSLKEPLISVIDFDSGAVVDTLEENPSTLGKMSDWGAPEINFEKLKNPGKPVLLNSMMDAWAVAVGIHVILTGFTPLSFLSDITPDSLKYYSSHYRWPNMDKKDKYFNKGNEELQDYLEAFWSQPELARIKEEFSYTFTEGMLKRVVRTTPKRWESIFLRSLKKNELIPGWYSVKNLYPDFPPDVISSKPSSSKESEPKYSPQQYRKLLEEFINKWVLEMVMGREGFNTASIETVNRLANGANEKGSAILAEISDFMSLLKECKKDGVITAFEHENLLYQGGLALLSEDTVNRIIQIEDN